MGTDDNNDARCWHARAWYALSAVYASNQAWDAGIDAASLVTRLRSLLRRERGAVARAAAAWRSVWT